MPKLLKIKSNFRDHAELLLGRDVAYPLYKETQPRTSKKQSLTAKEATLKDINTDLPRTKFFSRSHTLKNFSDLWLRDDTYASYCQGNMDARNIGNALFQKHIIPMMHKIQDEIKRLESNNRKPEVLKDTTQLDLNRNKKISDFNKEIGKLAQSTKQLEFGFIDKQGQACAFCLTYSALEPETFNVCILTNARDKPEKRQLSTYQASGEKKFPKLKEFVGEDSLKAGEFIEQSTLKQALLADANLPDEVKFMISDVINDNGQVNVEQSKIISNTFEVNSTNSTFIFNSEIKQDLQFYKTFCEKTIIQLNVVKVDSQTQAEILSNSIPTTLKEINQALQIQINTPQTDGLSLVNVHAKIQKQVLEHLKSASSDKTYQETINKIQQHCLAAEPELQAQRQKSIDLNKAHSSLKAESKSLNGQYTFQQQQKNTSLKTSGALTILTIAGAALVATGLIANPIGLAVATGIAIGLGISTLISWGITAYDKNKLNKIETEQDNNKSKRTAIATKQKENKSKLAENLNKLEQKFKQEIEKLKESGGEPKILELYLDKGTIESSQASQQKDTSELFKKHKLLFHKAVRDVSNNAAPSNKDSIKPPSIK